MLSIRNGMDFRLAQAVQEVKLGGFNLMVLTETNISTAAYCRNWLGYDIACLPAWTTSSGGAQGCMGQVLR